MRLKGKTAFITGGNSGIGLATARLFVAEGAQVAITGRNPETLRAAQKELGPNAFAIEADATDVAATERAVATAAEKFGKLDIVFANAGIGGTTTVGQTSLSDFEKIVRTNLTGVFFTIQAAAPYLKEGGSVILNGSVHAVLGMPGYSAYAATKAGVRAMTRNLASEFAAQGIRVNQVTPGGTRTPIWETGLQIPGGLQAIEERLSKVVPLGRMGDAEEVAQAALFLASDDSSNITGSEIVVDGGMTGAPSGAPLFR